MFAATMLVMLMSAAPSHPRTNCTTPLLSYSYDSIQAGDHTMVTCLICEDVVTWHVIDPDGGRRTIHGPIDDTSHLRGAVEQVQLGNIIESINYNEESPTIFYWAHPSDGPKFVLNARQKHHVWNNDAPPTATLIEAIDSVCSGR